MSQPSFKNQERYFIIGLIVLLIGLFAFKSNNSNRTVTGSIFEQTLSYNNSFDQLPKNYQRFIAEEPIDVILDSTVSGFEKIKALKYDAHIFENELYREILLIKKTSAKDTLLDPILLDVYPVRRKQGAGKYITFITSNITYTHEGSNYHVARQVLPNIEISKIVPYTKQWQTAILMVDNSMLLDKYALDLKKENQPIYDSLAIGLKIESSIYDLLFSKALKDRAIPFLSIRENITKNAILNSSESFKRVSKKENLKLVHIADEVIFWHSLTRSKEIPEFNFLNTDESEILKKLNNFITGNLQFEDIFDIEKLASYYALLNLYSTRSENSLFLNFNEETSLLEPFYIENKLGNLNTYVKNLKINDINFSKKYSVELTRVATLTNIKKQINNNKNKIKEILEVVHQNNPYAIFDEQLFVHNKLIIQKALNPSSATKIDLLKYDDNQIEVEVENLTNFPIEIAELSFRQKKFITTSIDKGSVIMPLDKKKVTFDLPDSYNNLFVQKKKKTTGFIFEKNIFDLFVGYRLVGTSDMKYNLITPFSEGDAFKKEDDLLRSESDLSGFDFITVDEKNKVIEIASETIVLSKPIVFPAGYLVKASSGSNINIISGGKIISKSPLNFIGSEAKPIKIYSSDRKGQGLFVVSAKATSELKYVEFDNLTNQEHGLWDLSGAVVFYESPVNLDHVLIANNSCEDGLNIIRTHFTMNNTIFRNTQSDAFDGDFVQGTLTNCTFENLGNDAIDVSGSSLEMYDLKIIKAGDKALSAGEDSNMKAERITIDQCEIAVAGKDLSVVEINEVTILNSKLGFTAFQKKPEFGASNITATNVVLKQVETAHLIENKSSLLLNGKQVETIDQVKEQMYGVEFGVDSKETRVKKLQ